MSKSAAPSAMDTPPPLPPGVTPTPEQQAVLERIAAQRARLRARCLCPSARSP